MCRAIERKEKYPEPVKYRGMLIEFEVTHFDVHAFVRKTDIVATRKFKSKALESVKEQIDRYVEKEYGYSYINMFGDTILIGPFTIEEAEAEKKKRARNNPKDKNPEIIKWNLKNYRYVYTPKRRVIKEPDDDFIPDNWEEILYMSE